MARSPAATDVYSAIAEPRRRHILELLGDGERGVGELVREMEIGQPTVSAHLRVLREVDLVRMRKEGRRRVYSLNAEALEPVRRWVETMDRFWNGHLDRVQARAEAKRRQQPTREEEQR